MRPDVLPRPTSALELLVALAAAAAAALIVAAIIGASDFSALDPAAGALGPTWAALMVGLALVGYLVQQRLGPGAPRRGTPGTGGERGTGGVGGRRRHGAAVGRPARNPAAAVRRPARRHDVPHRVHHA